MLGYGAFVPVGPDFDPNHGGGPIRRSGGVAVRSGVGMRPYGVPQMVYRTPHAVVPDAEPGGARWPGISKMKFLPDGRLVPAGALGGIFGLDVTSAETSASTALTTTQSLVAQAYRTMGIAGLATGAALAFLGGVSAPPGQRALGATKGLLSGFASGVAVASLATKLSSITAQLVQQTPPATAAPGAPVSPIATTLPSASPASIPA